MGIDTRPMPGKLLPFRLPQRLVDRPPRARPDGSLRGLRVLVVDDNPAHRDILCRYLSHWGVIVAGVAGADEALAGLRNAAALLRPIQLAILDLAMPQTDGFHLAATIRADERIPPLPLVLLTAFDHQGQAAEARESGFDAYLTKPVKHHDLLEALQALMRQPVGQQSA